MKLLRMMLPVSLALMLALLAFGTHLSQLQAMGASPNESAASVAYRPESVVPAALAAKATPTPQPTEESGGMLGEALGRLAQLDSYRSVLHMTWDGTDTEGQPTKGYIDIKEALVREPHAYRMDIEGEGFMDEEGGVSRFALVVIGDQAWYYLSDTNSWMQMPAGSIAQEAGTMSAQQILQQFELVGAEAEAKTEYVNDVECDHYTFTEREISISEEEGKIVSARGDAFIAVEGGFLVKLWVQADITGAGGEGALVEKGSMEFTYDVSDVNAEISIEAPTGAGQPSTREDIPMLPDAKVDFSSPDFIGYHTAKSVTEAGKFYEQEMPKNGWQADPGNTVQKDSAALTYTKGSDSAFVVITTDDQGTNVSILITAGEEVKTPEAKATLEAEETPEPEETVEPQLRADIPMLPDAKVDFSAEGSINYHTARQPREVGRFYEREMPKYAWEAAEDNNVANGYLEFTKDAEMATVYFSAEEKGTLVEIYVTSE